MLSTVKLLFNGLFRSRLGLALFSAFSFFGMGWAKHAQEANGMIPDPIAGSLVLVLGIAGVLAGWKPFARPLGDPRLPVIVLAGVGMGGSLVYLASQAVVSFREVTAGIFASLILAAAASEKEDWVPHDEQNA